MWTERLAWAWIVIAVVTFVTLFFIDAPYGRHTRGGWGPKVSARVGWILMEAPSPIVFAIWWMVFASDGHGRWVLLALWLIHYGNRAFVYPFMSVGNPMPLAVAGLGAGFNLVNGTLNGIYAGVAPRELDGGVRTWIGLALFAIGMAINLNADRKLRALKRAGAGYQIPRGGLDEYIASPNYFGEIVEWCGFAIVAWNLAALSFVIWTIANLVPRARAHRRWYREKFSDYPARRRVIIPFVY